MNTSNNVKEKSRLDNIITIPLAFTYKVIDSAIGVLGSMATICTLGMHQGTMNFASKHVSSFRDIIANPHYFLLKAINPDAKFENIQLSFHSPLSKIWKIYDQADKFFKSNSLLIKHVFSRITYVMLGLSCAVSMISNAILSVPLTLLSIITLGSAEGFNNTAQRSLRKATAIGELFICTVKIINPKVNTTLMFW